MHGGIAMEPTGSRFALLSEDPAQPEGGATGAPAEGPAGTGQTVFSRRAAIRGGAVGLAGLGGLLMFPGQLLAATVAPADPFIILLKGKYKPLVNPPNLSLHSVNLNDGSYSTVKIYPQRGVPDHTDQSKAIGNFYVQFAGDKAVYNLPKGSLVMQFTKGEDFGDKIPDGSGGTWLVGNFNLKVLEGTGIYRSFVGGHNLMVDILHALPDGKNFVEHCVCIVNRP